MSFYRSHATHMAEQVLALERVATGGGLATLAELQDHELKVDPKPVLSSMRSALDREGLSTGPPACAACKRRDLDSALLYLVAWPMSLGPAHFRVDFVD